MKKLLPVGLIVFAALIIGTAVTVFLLRKQLFRPDIHQAGGTLLTFEIEELPADVNPNEIAQVVQRRLDPTGAEGITARLEGEKRVVVGVTRTTGHEEHVEQIKRLLARSGKLEFRILANEVDDKEVIDTLKGWFDAPDGQITMKGREARKLPPPVVKKRGGGLTFKVDLPGEEEHAYAWVPLGEAEVKTLHLDPDSLKGEERPFQGPSLQMIQEHIKKRTPFLLPGRQSGLIFAQKFPGADEPTYYVLTRLQEKGKEVTGDFLEIATFAKDKSGRAALEFVLNRAGAERFHDLTTKNKPTGEPDSPFRRQLAIILDEQVLSAPSINSPIHNRGMITGDFTDREVLDMILILRSGSLPVRFKPVPVAVSSVKPGP